MQGTELLEWVDIEDKVKLNEEKGIKPDDLLMKLNIEKFYLERQNMHTQHQIQNLKEQIYYLELRIKGIASNGQLSS